MKPAPLNDPALRPATLEALKRHVPLPSAADGINDLWARLQADLKRAGGVSAEKEIRIARVLAQSAEPCVIQLLLQSGTGAVRLLLHNVA